MSHAVTLADFQRAAAEDARAQALDNLLYCLAHGYSRADACRRADLSRQTFYNWMRTKPDFRQEVEFAEADAASVIASVLYRCALKAEQDPRYLRAATAYLDRADRLREQEAEAQRAREAEERRQREAEQGRGDSIVPGPAESPLLSKEAGTRAAGGGVVGAPTPAASPHQRNTRRTRPLRSRALPKALRILIGLEPGATLAAPPSSHDGAPSLSILPPHLSILPPHYRPTLTTPPPTPSKP